MAVQALYFSDKDGHAMALQNPDTMLFTSRAEADARDRMLELAEEIRMFLERKVDGISEEMADQVAVAIARDKDLFLKGLKKPSVLNEDAVKAD